MSAETFFIVAIIALAFLFDFINGFHDAANSIATIVATKVLSPFVAVLFAAFFNFMAFFIFDVLVAETIGAGLINPELVHPKFIFSALIGAISWNLFTWYKGLPSSSSHALIGGMLGVALLKGGFLALNLTGLLKVAVGIVLSPVLGLLFGTALSFLGLHLLRHRASAQFHNLFKGFQLLSSAFLSLTHGSNDAQKTMGIIAVLLFSASWLGDQFYIPFWVVLSCYIFLSLGTLFGGWRIVHTLGTQITALNSFKGCMAETASAFIILVATEQGVPVSTTHTVTGSIAGVGLMEGLSGSAWLVLRKICLAWALTIPAAGLIAATVYFICFSSTALFLQGGY